MNTIQLEFFGDWMMELALLWAKVEKLKNDDQYDQYDGLLRTIHLTFGFQLI